MKQCLLCSVAQGDEVGTCPECGEATWSEPVVGGRDTRTEPIVAPALEPGDVVIHSTGPGKKPKKTN